jgi:SOS-response transcriptional repressor LexA
MELNTVQKRITLSKPFGFSVVKGKSGSGKTTAALYRVLHLKNNYCLYDEDGILVVDCIHSDSDKLREKYNMIEKYNRLDYISLFSSSKENVYIYNLQDIVKSYYSKYIYDNNMQARLIENNEEKLLIIKQCKLELQQKYTGIKILNKGYDAFFLEEIAWIKSCIYSTLETYQEADRVGRRYKKGMGPQRLLKNSKERTVIYELMELYNLKLRERQLVDTEDMKAMALKQVKSSKTHLYTHIIADGCENLTRLELELLKSLNTNRTYSSLMFLADMDKNINSFAWFIKGRKLNALGLGVPCKSFSLSKIFSTEEEVVKMEEIKEIDEKKHGLSFIESYEYIDIRHNRSFEFLRDGSNISELILKQDEEELIIKQDELKDLPVYSDIAAGEPIQMNPDLEADFYLPEFWLKGLKDCFILKVKGDSMEGAKIEDGDYVVIRKQFNALNKDIVAVDIDGSATLKRLSLGKGGATLLPENPRYSPIPLYGTDAKILGIAVGIIKSNN